MSKRISVCIATYNGAKYIQQQIKSILLQLGDNDEVIVSDDSSTDNTLEIIRAFNDSRIKVIINRGTNGYTGNFENALRAASGEIIFLSDQDDVWKSNKVEVMLTALEKFDFVVSDAELVDENLITLANSNFERMGVSSGLFSNLIRCRYLGCCYAFKSKLLKIALPIPSNHIYCPHDYWLSLVAESMFSVCLVKEPLIYYRRHSSNVSDGGAHSSNSFFKKALIRLYVVNNLCFRFFQKLIGLSRQT